MIKEINWNTKYPICEHPTGSDREVLLSSKPIGWISDGYMLVGYIIEKSVYDKSVLFGCKRESISKRATHAKFIEV